MSGVGSAVSVTYVRETVDAVQPEALVQVSPDFTNDDQFNTYNTIQAALTRADALLIGGADRVEIYCHAGEYEEDNLVIKSKIILSGSAAAVLLGVPSPTVTNPILRLQGTAIVRNITISTQAARNNQIYLDPLAQATMEGVFIDCQPGGIFVQNHIFLEEDPLQAAGPNNTHLYFIFSTATIAKNGSSGALVAIRTEGRARISLYTSNVLIAGGTAGIYLENTTQPFGSLQLEAWNSTVVNIFGDSIVGEANCKCDLLGTSTKIEDITMADGKDAIARWPFGAKDISQTTYPEAPSATVGSVHYALETIKGKLIVDRSDIERNLSNIALHAAEAARDAQIVAGDYEALLVEGYENDSDIDLANSQLYEIENGLVEFVKSIDIDDFESYANTTALRAVWVPDGSTTFTCNLLLTGGYLGGKFMELPFSLLTTNGYVQKTYVTPQDWTFINQFCFYVRGTGDSELIDLIIKIEDNNGSVATLETLKVVAGVPWIHLPCDDSVYTAPSNFRWWAIKKIRFVCGTVAGGQTGTWQIDVIDAHLSDGFVQSSLIDAMDSVGSPPTNGWTIDVGSINVVTSSAARQGTGYFEVDSVSWTLTRQWPGSGSYAANMSGDTLVRLWAKVGTVTVGGSINSFILKLTDESGNKVQNVGLITYLSSSESAWRPISWFLSDMTLVTGTSFDFTKIVKIEIAVNGVTGTWKVHLDLFEVGDGTVVQEIQQTKNSFNQIKAFVPFGGTDHFRLDVSGNSAAGFDLNNMFQSGSNFGIRYGGTGSKAMGSWVSLVNVSSKIQFRLVGIGYPGSERTVVSGVSILWRTSS